MSFVFIAGMHELVAKVSPAPQWIHCVDEPKTSMMKCTRHSDTIFTWLNGLPSLKVGSLPELTGPSTVLCMEKQRWVSDKKTGFFFHFSVTIDWPECVTSVEIRRLATFQSSSFTTSQHFNDLPSQIHVHVLPSPFSCCDQTQ